MTISLYSKRLLNPFTGMAQVMETENARAISTEGVDWRIQIRTDIYKFPWRELAVPSEADEYFAFGIWCRETGLAKLPVHPTLYEEHVEQAVSVLVTLLQKHSHNIPFTARDQVELWLLDKENMQPVVLVASETENKELKFSATISWLACNIDDTTFSTTAYTEQPHMTMASMHAKDLLNAMVQRRIGNQPTAIWLKRNPFGYGELLQSNRQLPESFPDTIQAKALPPLQLTNDWQTPQQQQLYNDYIAWLAPVLLTLPTLDIETRCELEKLAEKKPLQVSVLYRLYPTICDQALINKTLIEAQIRAARQ